MTTHEFTVGAEIDRLDKLLLNWLPQYSRAQLQKWIEDGLVTVNGKAVKAGSKPRSGENVQITIPAPQPTTLTPEAIPLDILYEDADLVVIHKPAGMVVHPGAGNPGGTLVNALLAQYPEMQHMTATTDEGEDEAAEVRAGIVHRLDKDTSGIIVVAKHTDALTALMEQFRDRTVEKTYIALLERAPKTQQGIIDAPIARDPKFRQKMTVLARGRPAITEFEVTDNQFKGGQALVTLKPRTGRTHQIRVHMHFIGCPVVGDTVYGMRRKYPNFARHFLHAATLSFDHPRSGKRLTFTAPLPAELTKLLELLR
jgi:23S rRNA pseudouridine1911/1915/1917 synthase